MSHRPTSLHNRQSPALNQKPPSRVSIYLWIGFVLFLATGGLGVVALVMGQNKVIAAITFLVTLLSLPIGILQVDSQGRLIAVARQTIGIGRRVVGIALLIASLALNAYFIFGFHQASSASLPSSFRTTMTPIRTSTPPFQPVLQQQRLWSDSNTTVIQVGFLEPVMAKNLIIVAITQWEGTVTSVSDIPGDTYIQVPVAPHANTSRDFVELYYAKSVRGGATTVKVHFSTAGDSSNTNDMNVGIYEYSGLETTDPLDQVVSNTGHGSDLDGGTLRSTMGNELYFVVGVDDDGKNTAPTAGGGYTLMKDHQDDSENERFYAEERIAGPGSFQTDFSIATSSFWAVIGASFKPA